MPIKVECPHCRQALAVPSKYLGKTANCPQCKGTFQMPADVPGRTAGDSSASLPVMSQPPAGGAAESAAGPAAPPAGGTEGRWLTSKVARFIAHQSVHSTIQPEADGSLPGLELEEAKQRKKPEAAAASGSPMVMTVVMCVSIASSLLLLLVDFEPSQARRLGAAQARRDIEEKFFHDPPSCPNSGCDFSNPRHLPQEHDNWRCDNCGHQWRVEPSKGPRVLRQHQILLRRAQQAHARGDQTAERYWYRQVLKMLHEEDRNDFVGLTNRQSSRRDEELERLINAVLNQ